MTKLPSKSCGRPFGRSDERVELLPLDSNTGDQTEDAQVDAPKPNSDTVAERTYSPHPIESSDSETTS